MRYRFPPLSCKCPDLSISSCGLQPPVFVLFWKFKVQFSHHFFFLFPILTLQPSDKLAGFATDLLPVLPPPKISPYFLISLRGNEKCSVPAGGSAAVFCMDVKISEAVHITHVGWGVRNGVIWISGTPQWVEGKLHTCVFSWLVAADATKKQKQNRTRCWFTQIHQHCGCFISREKICFKLLRWVCTCLLNNCWHSWFSTHQQCQKHLMREAIIVQQMVLTMAQ